MPLFSQHRLPKKFPCCDFLQLTLAILAAPPYYNEVAYYYHTTKQLGKSRNFSKDFVRFLQKFIRIIYTDSKVFSDTFNLCKAKEKGLL